jgi:hypothetical protein
MFMEKLCTPKTGVILLYDLYHQASLYSQDLFKETKLPEQILI